MLTAAYYILKDDVSYHELGADYFEPETKLRSLDVSYGALKHLDCPWRSGPLRNIDTVSF